MKVIPIGSSLSTIRPDVMGPRNTKDIRDKGRNVLTTRHDEPDNQNIHKKQKTHRNVKKYDLNYSITANSSVNNPVKFPNLRFGHLTSIIYR